MAETVVEEQEGRARADWLEAVRTGHSPADLAYIKDLEAHETHLMRLLACIETVVDLVVLASGQIRTSQVLEYMGTQIYRQATAEGDARTPQEQHFDAWASRKVWQSADLARYYEAWADETDRRQIPRHTDEVVQKFMDESCVILIDRRRAEKAEALCAEEADGPSLEGPPQE